MMKNSLSVILQNLIIIGCLLVGTGCGSASTESGSASSPNTKPVLKPVVIKSGEEDGHPAGIRLAIQRTSETDSSTRYELISSFDDHPMGLVLIIPREGVAKPARNAYFISLGAPSDLFLQFLAEQYHQISDAHAKFTDSIAFICMNLHSFYSSDSLKAGDWIAAEYKLFFDSEKPEGDAELFMNINADRQWAEFAEKDADYRPALIHLFTKN